MFVPHAPTRLLSAAATVGGLLHLVAPRTLLGIAARAYDHVLAVDFQPRDGAGRRVRAVGVVLLVIGLALARRSERR